MMGRLKGYACPLGAVRTQMPAFRLALTLWLSLNRVSGETNENDRADAGG